MASSGLRLLIKAHPRADSGRLNLDVGRADFTLTPLMPDIEKPRKVRLSAKAPPIWHLATSKFDDINPWDACHRLMQEGLGIAGQAGVSFAEPDLEQQWPWATEARQALGLTGVCDNAEPQDADVYAVGPTDFWFGGSSFSQLDAAREAVGDPGAGDRIRIAHLDTGYDKVHATKPAHVNSDLERDFCDDEGSGDASDRDSGILTNFGHGTATLALLAGDLSADQPIGGAANLEIVPIRVAKAVVLFKNSAIAQALNYVHSLSNNPNTRIDVVTMSMGGLASAAWADAVNALYDRGVFVVTAAGNNFGNLPTRYIVYPARFRRVVAACGVMADGRPYADLPFRKMAGCYGPRRKEKTAMAAYTPNVPWARIGCPELVDQDGGGTSSATPQIAAAAALWIQKHKEEIEGKYDRRNAWMRVEAVRNALFESVDQARGRHRQRRLGHGILRAEKALAVSPADAGDLTRQKKDSVSFPLIRVLTGLGIAGQPSDLQRMLELEALHISQRSQDVEAALADVDPSDPEGDEVDRVHRRRLLEALADHPEASQALKTAVSAYMHHVNGGPTPPSPTPVGGAGSAGAPPPSAPPAPALSRALAQPIYAAEPPSKRRLRVYAFDPLLGTRLETLHLNEATISIPWEQGLKPGPVGEYLEVVDIDPPSNSSYAPVDLNQPEILAQHGLAPAEGLPQFHQQMVYAVAMKTITHFEEALGRVALWAEREATEDGEFRFRFVRRLRIYPHGLREANAFYHPGKWALLYGYFNASRSDAGDNLPGGLVFTCLSHDIVAHETTHALLDGIHPYFKEPTNDDMLAFHEAFSDIVAIFQHFTMPEALRDRIAKARGDLRVADLLGGLAGQFGQALGQRGALRSAISRLNKEKNEWERIKPSQEDYEAHREPHSRGAVLVAAVFDAFLQIYEQRTLDLVRLATGGSGVLPPGAISHDLTERLAQEAAKTAGHVLNVCIRALDYCPPVDLTFGEYLRALVTADRDLVPDDDRSYRVAFVSAFRERGIFPPGVTNLSVDALAWQTPDVMIGELASVFEGLSLEWKLDSDRLSAFIAAGEQSEELYNKLHELKDWNDQTSLNLLGVIVTKKNKTVKVIDGVRGEISKTRILSVRPVRRLGPGGRILDDMVIEITQRWKPRGESNFYRGGCTIIYDADAQKVKYIIRKRLGNKVRTEQQKAFAVRFAESTAARTYFSPEVLKKQPFALLHRDH